MSDSRSEGERGTATDTDWWFGSENLCWGIACSSCDHEDSGFATRLAAEQAARKHANGEQ